MRTNLDSVCIWQDIVNVQRLLLHLIRRSAFEDEISWAHCIWRNHAEILLCFSSTTILVHILGMYWVLNMFSLALRETSYKVHCSVLYWLQLGAYWTGLQAHWAWVETDAQMHRRGLPSCAQYNVIQYDTCDWQYKWGPPTLREVPTSRCTIGLWTFGTYKFRGSLGLQSLAQCKVGWAY